MALSSICKWYIPFDRPYRGLSRGGGGGGGGGGGAGEGEIAENVLPKIPQNRKIGIFKWPYNTQF